MVTPRRFVEASVCLGIILVLCCGASADQRRHVAATDRADWLQTGWNAEHQGAQDNEAYLDYHNAQFLAVSWTNVGGD